MTASAAKRKPAASAAKRKPAASAAKRKPAASAAKRKKPVKRKQQKVLQEEIVAQVVLEPLSPDEDEDDSNTPLKKMARMASESPDEAGCMVEDGAFSCMSARDLGGMDFSSARVIRAWYELVGSPLKGHGNVYHSINSVCKHSGGNLQLRRYRVRFKHDIEAVVWWMLGSHEDGRHEAYVFEEVDDIRIAFVGVRAHDCAAMQIGYEFLAPGMSLFSHTFDGGFRAAT